jgi:hypothetical protein
MTKGRAFAAAAAALLFLIISQTASAQYPPPQGSLICQLAQSQVYANSTLVMTVRLIDNNGNSVPGQQVNFSLGATNGTAYLYNGSSITDGNGQASVTVYAGANNGYIQVQASTNVVACSSSFQIYSPPPPPYVPPPVNPCDYAPGSVACCTYSAAYPGCVNSVTIYVAPPPPTVYQIIVPPNTGDAGLAATTTKHSSGTWWIVGGMEVAILLVLSTWLVSSQIRGTVEETNLLRK